MLYVFFRALTGVDLSLFSPEERQIMDVLLGSLETLRLFYYAVLAMQALALGMLATRVRFGLGLAIVASIIMLPWSLIYLIGCALSHYRGKYAEFTLAPPDAAKQGGRVFSAGAIKKLRFAVFGALAFSFGCLAINWYNVGTIAFGFGLAAFYTAARARKNPALALYQEYFTVTPSLFADSLLIRYDAVRSATLHDNESILLKVENSGAPGSLVWSLRSVETEQRRAALEELGAALSAHSVPLY